MSNDFIVSKFYSYSGPNYYIDRQATVFNLYIDPEGPLTDFYLDAVTSKIPSIREKYPERVVDLFAEVLSNVYKMDMDLFTRKYTITHDDNEYVIALEHLDDYLAEEAVYFVRDWFRAINGTINDFDYQREFERLQEIFNKTIFGGPTIYSLIEGAIKRKINVHYLREENQFQWGYGKKQIRGRSTTFHIDGIKDTEFTMYKDMVGEWLEVCGFPTPRGVNCFSEEKIVEKAQNIGFPVVIKPVSGHKGQGVATGVESEEAVRKAFNNIVNAAKREGVAFDGALVQQQIYGYDHRILTVGGNFAACLKRVPAFVTGNGKDTIERLIEAENSRDIRLDNARSPLCKIVVDDDLTEFLELQNKDIRYIPADGEQVVLRRVANISAGGVSYNVTDDIHPDNIELVENIAKYFKVTCMGIDVLAGDISKSWQDGNFGIIEINAGPGVFMHLVPAYGGPVDVPGKIMEHLFGQIEGYDRVPIIVGNNISNQLINNIYNSLHEYKQDVEVGALRKDGLYFNSRFFTRNSRHDKNCQILFRNRKLDFAIVNHTSDQIHDYGIWHQRHDIAILDNPNYAEEKVMKRDLLPGGLLIHLVDTHAESGEEVVELTIYRDGEELTRKQFEDVSKKDEEIFYLLEPSLRELLFKYDYYLKLENKPENLEIDRVFVKEFYSN